MKVTTSDGTATQIGSFTLGNNQAGVIEATVAAFDATNGLAVTGKKAVRYKKVNGTLTLGTPVDIAATVADTGLAGSFTFVASSNNIVLQVTGVSGKTAKWNATVVHTIAG